MHCVIVICPFYFLYFFFQVPEQLMKLDEQGVSDGPLGWYTDLTFSK